MNSKVCANRACVCKGQPQALTEFYVRSGKAAPTLPGHYVSECKACYRRRSRETTEAKLLPTVPRAYSEVIAIDYLHNQGIAALPGKAVHAADVDVVCWGCVRIEVKWSPLDVRRGRSAFQFNATPRQTQRGFLADLVMLICEYPDEQSAVHGKVTIHLFEASDPVFYINGHVKNGLIFALGLQKATRHGETRVVMTQPMMDAAQDRLDLIEAARLRIAARLKNPA